MRTGHIGDALADLYHRIAELERRLSNTKRTGKVTDVDGAKGLVRVDLGRDDDGNVVKSPWIKPQEIAAGGLKSSFLPTVGEQIDVISENGDMTDAYASMSLPSKDNKRPHDKPGEGVFEKGPMRIEMAEDRIILKVGNAKIAIRDGEIVAEVAGAKTVLVASEITHEAGQVHVAGKGGPTTTRFTAVG